MGFSFLNRKLDIFFVFAILILGKVNEYFMNINISKTIHEIFENPATIPVPETDKGKLQVILGLKDLINERFLPPEVFDKRLNAGIVYLTRFPPVLGLLMIRILADKYGVDKVKDNPAWMGYFEKHSDYFSFYGTNTNTII